MTAAARWKYSIGWLIGVPLLSLAWALLFWRAFFVSLSWETWRIPMGLGGAVYPALFWPYVLVGALAWEVCVGALVRPRTSSRVLRILVTLGLPFVAVSLLLIVFCPMDVPESYLSYVFTHRVR